VDEDDRTHPWIIRRPPIVLWDDVGINRSADVAETSFAYVGAISITCVDGIGEER
jgi:hypothetical protein